MHRFFNLTHHVLELWRSKKYGYISDDIKEWAVMCAAVIG